jgi:hypothetical protein
LRNAIGSAVPPEVRLAYRRPLRAAMRAIGIS